MKEVMEILEKTDMTRRAYEIAVKIFTILGEAEAKAHWNHAGRSSFS